MHKYVLSNLQFQTFQEAVLKYHKDLFLASKLVLHTYEQSLFLYSGFLVFSNRENEKDALNVTYLSFCWPVNLFVRVFFCFFFLFF